MIPLNTKCCSIARHSCEKGGSPYDGICTCVVGLIKSNHLTSLEPSDTCKETLLCLLFLIMLVENNVALTLCTKTICNTVCIATDCAYFGALSAALSVAFCRSLEVSSNILICCSYVVVFFKKKIRINLFDTLWTLCGINLHISCYTHFTTQ